MIYRSEEVEGKIALATAQLMLTAARTAPKGCGVDKIEALIIDGPDKFKLSTEMRKIAKEIGMDFFERDAGNVDNSHCVVLLGIKNEPLGLDSCGLCGFHDCKTALQAGSHCTFNVTDLGIALGSAVSVAADHRIDNRIFYSGGRAALRCSFFESDVKLCYAIPLSTCSKSIFFDRDPGNVSV